MVVTFDSNIPSSPSHLTSLFLYSQVNVTLAGIEVEKVIPTEHGLQGFDLSDPATIELIHLVQKGDAVDCLLSLRQALKKYKKALFWRLFLSTILTMEGYDVVIVRERRLLW